MTGLSSTLDATAFFGVGPTTFFLGEGVSTSSGASGGVATTDFLVGDGEGTGDEGVEREVSDGAVAGRTVGAASCGDVGVHRAAVEVFDVGGADVETIDGVGPVGAGAVGDGVATRLVGT